MKYLMRAMLCGALLYWCGAPAAIADPLPRVTAEAAQSWKQLGGGVLTPAGDWLAYSIRPASLLRIEPGSVHDVVTVVARRVQGDEERRYPAGLASKGGGAIQLSPSGRWLAFTRAPLEGAARTVLVDLVDERSEEIAGAVFSLSAAGAASGEWLVVQSGGSGTGVLRLQSLGGGDSKHIEGVYAFDLDASGARLAVSSTRGLEVYELSASPVRSMLVAAAEGGEFSALSWSADGRGLAALHSRGDQMQVYAAADIGRPSSAVRLAALSERGGTPQGPLQWRDTRDGVYYQVRHTPVASAGQASAVSDDSPVRVDIWRAGDRYLPAEQARLDASAVLTWQYLDLSRKVTRALTDASLTLVAPQGRGTHVLAYDTARYGWMNPNRAANLQSRDYYLISLRTGERRVLVRNLRVPHPALMAEPRLSPDGALFLYPQDGHYQVQELASGRTRNLTAPLSVRLMLPGNDPVAGSMPDDGGHIPAGARFQGWSKDGEYVLVSNHWDVWALPLRAGREAVNLTGDGEREERVYARVDPRTSALDATPADLSASIYFRVIDMKTGKWGLAKWMPDEGARVLHTDYAQLSYIKAARADVWVTARATAVEPLEYYRVDERFSVGERLTDGNPQHRQYARSPGVRFLRYTTERGDVRYGLLRLPVGYEEGKRYPTMVEIYKGRNAQLHLYTAPWVASNDYFLENGYAVLEPDIVISRMNDAGQIALENVMAGVDAGVATGVVDGERLGLRGHSYGAFQALYILTQTDRFRVAEAYAGLSNLWSWCNGLYGGWAPGMTICESGQPYFSGPWWMHWDAYLANSPLYQFRQMKTPLLLVHGTDDDAVPFTQSVELFNSLRRHGGVPVVLLAYPGQGHELEGEAKRDHERRRHALFDHYLQGAEAPDWWDTRRDLSH